MVPAPLVRETETSPVGRAGAIRCQIYIISSMSVRRWSGDSRRPQPRLLQDLGQRSDVLANELKLGIHIQRIILTMQCYAENADFGREVERQVLVPIPISLF